MKQFSPQAVVFAGSALIVGALFAAILWVTGGHFTYILDDTYIYLALAENLPFNYSINAPGAEGGASSSSVIYPYLLMPLAHTSWALAAPLLINIAGAVLVLLLLLRFERRLNPLPWLGSTGRGLVVLLFAFFINLFTIIFTGMEHTLHVAATLAVLDGLLDLTEGRAPRWWFWLGVFMGPMLRYEALALSLPALVYAATLGQWRCSLWVGGLMLGVLLAFSFYLVSLGYGWLPSSVLSKSIPLATVSEGMSRLTSLVAVVFNFILNFNEPTAWIHAILLLIVVWLFFTSPQHRGLLMVVALTGAAQLVLGKFGWAGRYHPYALALLLLTIWYVAGSRLKRSFLIELTFLAGSIAFYYTAIVPVSALQIYRYHGTVHEFLVNNWQDDIAAYDIGYMAWQNPHAVVDLFGLGSERIRRLIHKPDAAQVVPQLLEDEHIDLIIAEKKLLNFYNRPYWKLVGELHVPGRAWVTGLNPRFYLTNPARAEELRQKLEALRPHLPEGVTLQVYQ